MAVADWTAQVPPEPSSHSFVTVNGTRFHNVAGGQELTVALVPG
jgi:hypothetical protein